MSARVTRRQAEQALAAIVAHFPGYEGEHANLRDHHHEQLPHGCWSIDWEDGALDGWAMELSEVPMPTGVWVDAINGCIAAVLPS